MSETKSLPAKYDPDRLPNGHFVPGNKAGGLKHNPNLKRLAQLRSIWFDSLAVEDMIEVKASLKDLALNCPNPDVKLKAQIYFLDRCLGKPTERVEIESQSTTQFTIPDLTPDELAVMQKIIQKADEATDAEFIIMNP